MHQCMWFFFYLLTPLHLPSLASAHSSTRLQSSFTNGSSRPAWMLSWSLWRTWPMHPGTSPSPRSSSTWTAFPCSLRWWRAGLSKSIVVLKFLHCSCGFFFPPQTPHISHSYSGCVVNLILKFGSIIEFNFFFLKPKNKANTKVWGQWKFSDLWSCTAHCDWFTAEW